MLCICTRYVVVMSPFVRKPFTAPISGQPSNGPIRLWRSGTTSVSYTSGIVQLLYNSRWGNICDESGNFGVAEASVICHQLGYTGAHDFYNSTSSEERTAMSAQMHDLLFPGSSTNDFLCWCQKMLRILSVYLHTAGLVLTPVQLCSVM